MGVQLTLLVDEPFLRTALVLLPVQRLLGRAAPKLSLCSLADRRARQWLPPQCISS